MATISAQMVGDLKKKTGAGLMDCKKALVETQGNVDAAIKLLREKGLAAAAKKADRIAADGLVSVLKDGDTVAMVEVNSETDFVAKNATFVEFVQGHSNGQMGGMHLYIAMIVRFYHIQRFEILFE